jgi:hypothetical protein
MLKDPAMPTLKKTLCSALFALASLSANAAVIDFEGVVAAGGRLWHNATAYLEDGYTLATDTPGGFHNDIFGEGNFNTNGSAVFGWCAITCGPTETLTLTGPSAFSITSIDLALLDQRNDAIGTVQLTGLFQGGGQIVQTFNYAGTWSTESLSGFTNLAALQIVITGGPDAAMDNLVVDAAQVPEPASLALFGLGLGVAGLARRRAGR